MNHFVQAIGTPGTVRSADIALRYYQLIKAFLSSQKKFYRRLHDIERAIASYVKQFPLRYTASYFYHQFRDAQ